MNKRELRGVLTGMVLGDGFIYQQKGRKYPNLTIEQTDYDLIQHKKSILEDITSVYVAERNRHDRSKTYRLQTKQHPQYKVMRDLIYRNGNRSITKTVLKALTPEGIAIWYMDDGSWQPRYNTLRLHTDAYGLTGNEIIRDYFKEYHDVEFRIEKCGKENHNYRLVITNKDNIRKFVDIVKPFIIPSMKYKIANTQGDMVAYRYSMSKI